MSDHGKPLYEAKLQYCSRCCLPETVEGIKFDEMGICQACQSSEQKIHINWIEREKKLIEILEEAKRNSKGNYDCIVPISGGKDSTRIEVLQGPDYAETDTTEYHRDKLVVALKMPKSFMGAGGEATRGALSSEDIRFARTVMRLQREIRNGIRKALRVHLIAKGADVDRADFDVKMTVPSAIMELARLEVMSATADLAQRMQETVPVKWILMNLYKFSEEEATRMMAEKDSETKRRAKVEAAAQKILNAAEGGDEGGEEEGFTEPKKKTPKPKEVEFGQEEEPEEEPEEEGPPKPGQPGKPGGRFGKPGGKPKPGKPGGKPQVTSLGVSKTSALLEQRMMKILDAHERSVRRGFDGKVGVRVEAKLDRLIKTDESLSKRLKNLEGLMADIRPRM